MLLWYKSYIWDKKPTKLNEIGVNDISHSLLLYDFINWEYQGYGFIYVGY